MTPEFKKAWVEALRSGKYQQGKRALCRLEGGKKQYCCMGVGYLIAKGIDPPDSNSGYIDDTIDHIGVPEEIVGAGNLNETAYTLAVMNDEKDKSFSEIADYIEQNL